jgi:hypothetical protein
MRGTVQSSAFRFLVSSFWFLVLILEVMGDFSFMDPEL